MWLQLQVDAFSACFSGHCVGRISNPKGRRTPQGWNIQGRQSKKFSIFIHLKAFCSKFQTFQHSMVFEFLAEDFITQVCWTFLGNLAMPSSRPVMRKNFGNFNMRKEGEQLAKWSKPLVSTFKRKEGAMLMRPKWPKQLSIAVWNCLQ